MKRKLLLFIFFLATLSLSFGQEGLLPFRDSAALIQELKLQEEIPSFSYKFFIPKVSKNSKIPGDSTFLWVETDTAFISKAFKNGTLIDSLYEPLKGDSASILFFVYEEKTNINGLRSYLETMYATGDFVLAEDKEQPENDILLVASSNNYQPLDAYKNRLLGDFKLLAVTLIILFFIFSAASMIIFMLIFKTQRNQREENIKNYEQEIIGPLTNLLFEKDLEEISQMSNEEISDIFPKSLFKKRLFKQVLIERIIGLNKKMKGEFKDKLKTLYKRLGLVELTKANLKDSRWDKISAGLVQVNEMDLGELINEVKSFTNSKNFYVRSLAGATLLNLSEKVDLSFLKDQDYPLSDWQQMNYLRIIKFVGSSKFLNIPILLKSKNQSVREFAIKLVRMLGRVDLIAELHMINEASTDDEKIELINTYDALGAHMEVEFINNCMLSTNPDLKKIAVKAAGNLGNSYSEVILMDILVQTIDFRLRRACLTSLSKLNTETFEKFVSTQPLPENQALKAQIQDPLLSNV
ncbi:hypothetical protein [Algoriphagus algorifonticola]|uniref:hypothetical protein n=1 Tax=Algoriphagus algorifonticola TaxID=2593007 RepID=UPI0011A7EE4E|nr:hypothetical protein [Algoriphagus algorifonticola]